MQASLACPRGVRKAAALAFVISAAAGIGYKRAFQISGSTMRRFLLALFAVFAASAPAHASASYGCTSADDPNVASLEFEAVTSRDGKYLDSFRGELELTAGIKIEFEKKDVKSHNWGRNIAVVFGKPAPGGAIEVRIYAKPKPDDEIEFVGNYVVTAGKIRKSGKIVCSGG